MTYLLQYLIQTQNGSKVLFLIGLASLFLIVLLLKVRVDTKAYIITALFVLFLIIFGWRFHTIEEVGSAELDRYVYRAEQICSGHLIKDPCHPLLYPMLSAGVGTLLGDIFSGARVVSSCFAGLFVLLTYLIGRICFNKEVGLFALFAMVFNYSVIVEGLHATLDMTFASLALLTLFFSILVINNPRRIYVLFLAVAFSLSYSTKYAAVALIPVVMASLCYPFKNRIKKDTILNLTIFFIVTGLCLLPHFYITKKLYGSAFYNSYYTVFEFKMYANLDWSYCHKFNNIPAVIMSSPRIFITSFFQEFREFILWGLRNIGCGANYLCSGYLFTILFLLGVYKASFSLNRPRALIFLYVLTYITMVCLSFKAFTRIMLPILPLCYIFIGNFIIFDTFAGTMRLGKIFIKRYIPVAAIFLFALSQDTAGQIPGFIERHPVKEKEAAIMLEKHYGQNLTVLGTCQFVDRYVKYRYFRLDDAHGEEIKNDKKYYDRIKEVLARTKADYVIVGKVSLGNRPVSLLEPGHSPDYFTVIFSDDDITVFKVEKSKL